MLRDANPQACLPNHVREAGEVWPSRQGLIISAAACDHENMTFMLNPGLRRGGGGRRAGISGSFPNGVAGRQQVFDQAACQDGAGPPGRRGDGGFTLLEVLVAFAIAAPALALLYRQGVASLGTERTAAGYQEAISRAQSHLDALDGGKLSAGEQTGDDGAGFTWRLRVAPVASTAPPRPVPRASPYAGGTTLFAVAVEIAWPGPHGKHTLTLNTRRLDPATAAAP